MIISATARHYIGNEATLNELMGPNGIIERTLNVLGKEAKDTFNRRHQTRHKLRINYDSKFGKDNLFELREKGEELRKQGMGFNLQINMGPGSSFMDGLLHRDADISILYGADQIHINKNLECFAELCSRLRIENKTLGGAARPYKILLSDIPEGDLMRQIHEIYHVIAAGGYEGRKVDNPFNFDLSRGSPLFVGYNGEGGFGDLNADFAAINHNSPRAQIVCQNLVDIARMTNPNNFCSEYGIFISEGIKNIEMIYMDFSENRFYRDKDKLTKKDIEKDIENRSHFIRDYAYELGKVPHIRNKLHKVLYDSDVYESIERNLKGYNVESASGVHHNVEICMKEGLVCGTIK